MTSDDRPALPASFTTTRCLVVSCRTCEQEFADPDSEAVLHFDHVDEAADAVTAAGWWLTQDGVQCDTCAATEACARYGHAWERWRDCGCGGLIPDHTRQMQARHCASCQAREERPHQRDVTNPSSRHQEM
jgi:hypothetical protein